MDRDPEKRLHTRSLESNIMSGGLIDNPIARAPRQSGLKKPRPLRSVSLQEGPVQGRKDVPERQTSHDDTFQSECTNDLRKNATDATVSTVLRSPRDFESGNEFRNFSQEKDESLSRSDTSTPLTVITSNLHLPSNFQRQSSSTSQDSFSSSSQDRSRKSSLEISPQSVLLSPTTTKLADPFFDANSNKLSVLPHSESDSASDTLTTIHKNKHGGNFENTIKHKMLLSRLLIHFKERRFSLLCFSIKHFNQMHGSLAGPKTILYSFSQRKMRDLFSQIVNQNLVVRRAPNHGLKHDYDRKRIRNINLATLMTPKGKRLVLSGTCIQTILVACKLLLQEIGASIIRLETVENTDKSFEGEVPLLSPNENNSEKELNISYSKEELLNLSESHLSRKPPAMWNILATTHADCCIPGSKCNTYFEQIDFHPHDGTLVVNEPKRKDSRREWE